jgi:hypothetical protein
LMQNTEIHFAVDAIGRFFIACLWDIQAVQDTN